MSLTPDVGPHILDPNLDVPAVEPTTTPDGTQPAAPLQPATPGPIPGMDLDAPTHPGTGWIDRGPSHQ